jgi:hypothetical protein
VTGGLTATEIVIVDCWQIVVDERKAVEDFDCASSFERFLEICADGSARRHRENRTQAFPWRESRVSHCASELDR